VAVVVTIERFPEYELPGTWTGVNHLIANKRFPRGRMMGRKRVWFEHEILKWIAGLPAGSAPLRGRAKKLSERAA
jgi:hypothetical protein